MSGAFELGVATFADAWGISAEQRLRDLMEEVRLADQLGLDVFGVGEHHRRDYAVSSPAVVLAAAAAVTRRIRLTSAVTVISSADPVRVFQDFATVDLLSGGRAELMAGRGSFAESFPLFGYDLADYDDLAAEKLELLLAIREREEVTWSGRFRPALRDALVWPRPLQDPLPVWVAVGGSPGSFARAGDLGLPLAVAVIGTPPTRFVPLVERYREHAARAGHDPGALPVAVNSHAFVASSQAAADRAFGPPWLAMMRRLARERGWGRMDESSFRRLRGPGGPLIAGPPEQVAEKILDQHALFGHRRYVAQMSLGAVAHRDVLASMELFGTRVAPLVRAEIARRGPAAGTAEGAAGDDGRSPAPARQRTSGMSAGTR
jgi:probable LLM family oxidoreductase